MGLSAQILFGMLSVNVRSGPLSILVRIFYGKSYESFKTLRSRVANTTDIFAEISWRKTTRHFVRREPFRIFSNQLNFEIIDHFNWSQNAYGSKIKN